MIENMPTNIEDEIHEDLTLNAKAKKKDVISDAKRINIIESLKSGTVTRIAASKIFNVNYNTICWIYRKYCLEGITQKKNRGGNNIRKLNEIEIAFIKNLLEEDCTLSLNKIKDAIFEKFNLSVSKPTINKYIDNFGFSFKRVSRVAARSVCAGLREHRMQYASWFLKMHNSNRMSMFYDETGFQVVMRKTYGRALKGKKAICTVPSIKSRNITVMATMSMSGLVCYEVLQRACNKTYLSSYLDNLIHFLSSKGLKNVIIIMDNASFHKCTEIRDLITNAGHELKFLPPYSPFFNPIENMFAQWKNIVRNLGPKDEDELMNAIGSFKTVITKEQCENYYRHIVNNHIDCINGQNVFDN